MARTEFALAQKLRPRKVATSPRSSDLRRDLIECHRRVSPRAEPDPDRRLQSGDLSAGGRFLPADRRRLAGRQGARPGLRSPPAAPARNGRAAFPGVRIAVPRTLVLTTDVFDRFLADNDLLDFAMHGDRRRRDRAPLPGRAVSHSAAREPAGVSGGGALSAGGALVQPAGGLAVPAVLRRVRHLHAGQSRSRYPGAAGAACWKPSSGCTPPPSASMPRPTCAPLPIVWKKRRWRCCCSRWWERRTATRFYPDFSGVVRSRNFYPMAPSTVADGFAAVALGMGRAVVGGGKCLTFSPRYPRHLVQFSSVEDILANSQTEFWALELDRDAQPPMIRRTICARSRFRLNVAEARRHAADAGVDLFGRQPCGV